MICEDDLGDHHCNTSIFGWKSRRSEHPASNFILLHKFLWTTFTWGWWGRRVQQIKFSCKIVASIHLTCFDSRTNSCCDSDFESNSVQRCHFHHFWTHKTVHSGALSSFLFCRACAIQPNLVDPRRRAATGNFGEGSSVQASNYDYEKLQAEMSSWAGYE